MATERPPPRLSAIVLAAGSGSRFGGGKLTAPWRGGRLIDGALACACAARVNEVVVVTGADPGVEAAVNDLFSSRGAAWPPVRTVYAADHLLGLSASLRAGMAAVSPDNEGVFLFLGDMPLIPKGTTDTMTVRLANGAVAVAPTWDGRRGHPVLFSRSLYPELMGIEGDEGARELLRELGERVSLVAACGPGVLLDVDAPRDLDALG